MNYVEVAIDYLLVKDYDMSAFLKVTIPWEAVFLRKFSVDIALHRRNIWDTIQHFSPTRERSNWYCHRWVHALFDSVDQHFSIGRFYYPTGVDFDHQTVDKWFGESMQAQNEFFPLGIYHGVPEDITIFEAERIKFSINDYVAIRPKLDGVRFVIVDGYVCGLGIRCKLPPAYKSVTTLEWYDGIFYIIHPIAIPTHVVGPLTLTAHPFIHPSKMDDCKSHEGVILLQRVDKKDVLGVERDHYVERRIKWKPSIEIMVPGRTVPWEVEWSYLTGHVDLVRPRPGKVARIMTDVRALGFAAQLSRCYPAYDLQIKNTGPFLGHFVRRGDSVLLMDSGYGVTTEGLVPRFFDPIPITVPQPKICGDALWYTFPNGHTYCLPKTSPLRTQNSLSNKYVTGAKVFIFHPVTGDYLLVREDKELFSIPGGRLEYGEDSRTALLRELKEELGLDLSIHDDIRYVGTHSSEEVGISYHTFVYIMALNYAITGKEPYRLGWSLTVPPDKVINYVPAHYTKVKLLTGDSPLTVLGYGPAFNGVSVGLDMRKVQVISKVTRQVYDTMVQLFPKFARPTEDSVLSVATFHQVMRVLFSFRDRWPSGVLNSTIHDLWYGSGVRILDFFQIVYAMTDVFEVSDIREGATYQGRVCVLRKAKLLPEVVEAFANISIET